MFHDWTYCDGGKETVVECSHCGKVYGLHQTRPVDGCKGRYVGDDHNRAEPDEEIKRQLGHYLEDV